MRKLKTGFLALLLLSGACLFSGCGQVDETILDNNADFSTDLNAVLDGLRHLAYNIEIETETAFAAENFAADLQKNSFIFWCIHKYFLSDFQGTRK